MFLAAGVRRVAVKGGDARIGQAPGGQLEMLPRTEIVI